MRTAAALGQSIFSAKGSTAALPAKKDSRNMFIATAEIKWVSPWNDQILMEHTFYMAFEGFRCLPHLIDLSAFQWRHLLNFLEILEPTKAVEDINHGFPS